MARIEWIEQRLLNWQRWRLTQGSGVLGYAASRPGPEGVVVRDPYAETPIPTNEIEASDTDDAVQRLHPGELKAAILVRYLGKLEPGNKRERIATCEKDQLAKLAIGRSTLYARIERAQRLLAAHFTARAETRKTERQRVERLQRTAATGGFTT